MATSGKRNPRLQRRPLRVLMLAGEMAPFAKVGGLADVVGALPPALRELGVDVRVVLPLYGCIDRDRFSALKKCRLNRTQRIDRVTQPKRARPGCDRPITSTEYRPSRVHPMTRTPHTTGAATDFVPRLENGDDEALSFEFVGSTKTRKPRPEHGDVMGR